LISDNTDFQTTCLDDVVTSWHKLVEKANIQGINENLELVYRLRPPPNRKQKGKPTSLPKVDDCDTANTPKDITPAQVAALIEAENYTAGPSNYMGDSATITEGLGAKCASDLEDAQLQWALQQSMMPQADQEGEFPGM
jgi:exonuclease V